MPSVLPRGYEEGELPVYWLLGLPVDLVDIERAMTRIEQAAAQKERLVFATPNVDFLSQAQSDPAFQESILRTQLSLVDGMPLVWLGRLLGIPIPERVAGSTLVERFLARQGERKLKVFFLGGPDGVAEAASDAVNRVDGSLCGAGAHQPGHGDVEEMSAAPIIDKINAAGADFLVVALGSKKGHAWIDLNASRLNVPVVSHLGACIKFLAGTVRRAPIAFQNVGLEWLWRTLQEPVLLRRYSGNAWFLLRQMGTTLPLAVRRARKRIGIGARKRPLRIEQSNGAANTLRLSGDLVAAELPRLQAEAGTAIRESTQDIRIDLSGVTDLDCAALGYLYRLKYRNGTDHGVRIVEPGRKALRLLRRHRAEVLLGDSAIEITPRPTPPLTLSG
jgi:N-acetylglucosaminyldiphosphoundecaprenol N-acetyl-beta-D-mannosaminyltransferase